MFEKISGRVWSTARPGYDHGRNQPVELEVVDCWIEEASRAGMRSILCLLDDSQLRLYLACPGRLLRHYREEGFEVGHLPVADHKDPPLTEGQLQRAVALIRALPKPVLVHWSAGMGRTGPVIGRLRELGDCWE
jgi:protein-tyrosine phosphatase